ncbi:Response regulator receiver domain-containing protein [Lishizhenia tianjinensis]|uniref:Response regulator receiver domain-containing protein n=1 Tax=Lishizhenia tianjinensis TaxID=477690 RepID=A0A1I7AL29_9FLAO|nr:response regulator [Lishizhenia tianjinensis]SFT75603.1 Response regulator receiver domain-containing protein [Lishizhenia tianjinensis]
MQTKILWADDEIELLKPHIMFLEQKGYDVQTVNNGDDAVEQCEEHNFDIVFLDENMPGISGLEALTRIKERNPMLPIVMITKSEEESIMEEAIGGKIADYLIKPVNPNQILLSLKKNLNQSKLVSQKTNANYQQEFRQIGMDLGDNLDKDEWKDIYKKLVYWELELDEAEDKSMEEILRMQKQEANEQFVRFIEDNYLEWLNGTEEAPDMLPTLIKNRVAPEIKDTTYLLVIDNLRYDQWQVLKPLFSKYFSIKEDDLVYSILPTATHYARNAFFAGLLPSEIAKKHPDLWKNEEDEGGKNMHEKELLAANLKRLGQNINFSYNKITNLEAGKKLNDNFHQLSNNDLNVIVYNFVDMLSHARTDMEVIRELADDESAYRSLTLSWFEHSPLFDIIKKIAQSKAKIVLTTDHGTVKVQNPVKIVGDKNVNTNLRYKTGKNLSYKAKEVFQVKDPQEAFLPKSNLSSEFVFAKGADFFVYPNNYNYFVNFYKNTFQHGGISLEEILIPFVVMEAK